MKILENTIKPKPFCIWFTGLSGSGKSTLAYATEQALSAQGRPVYVLDGDSLRQGLNSDLGFSKQDRIENIRRVAEVARLLVDAGLIVIVSLISPYKQSRLIARNLFETDSFFEIFVDTPIEVCEQRDVKGLYKKVRNGDIALFTGISSEYEAPESPELHLKTAELLLDRSLDLVMQRISTILIGSENDGNNYLSS
jgi:adenylyl-sulfate kinase